jgi:hypothetical protein
MAFDARRWLFAAALATVAGWADRGEAGQITTMPNWDGVQDYAPWGDAPSGNTPTYGQTFLATDSLSVLTSVMFEINNSDSNPFFPTSAITYRAYVYAWDGQNQDITGQALFASDAMTVTVAPGFQQVTVQTGTVDLNPGQQYVAFFSTLDQPNDTTFSSWGLLTPTDEGYQDGEAVFNNAWTFGELSAGPWDTAVSPGVDLAFTFALQAPVAPAPEPSTLGLGVMGALAGIGAWWRRRTAPARG